MRDDAVKIAVRAGWLGVIKQLLATEWATEWCLSLFCIIPSLTLKVKACSYPPPTPRDADPGGTSEKSPEPLVYPLRLAWIAETIHCLGFFVPKTHPLSTYPLKTQAGNPWATWWRGLSCTSQLCVSHCFVVFLFMRAYKWVGEAGDIPERGRLSAMNVNEWEKGEKGVFLPTLAFAGPNHFSQGNAVSVPIIVACPCP